MAAVARAQVAGGGMNGIKVALIVFVVLTVASLTYMVILYTHQSDLDAKAASAEQAVERANTSAQQARQELGTLTHRVLGEQMDDSAKIEETLKTKLDPMLKDEQLAQKIPADSSMAAVLDTLYEAYRQNADLLARTSAERKDLAAQLESLTKAAAEREKAYKEKAEQLEAQYKQLEEQTAANRQAWNQQVEDLRKRLEAATTGAAQQLAGERQTRLKLEQQLEQADKRVKELLDTLASYRPSADQLSMLQMADGTVVRAVAGQNLVYISLGTRDRVRPGLTFSVYSRARGVPESGQGKATIEVVNAFETTSEARVTSSEPGDPIVEGDMIANPVYDKNRRFNFAVAGDFDLNFDGVIDDIGGQRVAQLIERWGGGVVPVVDTRTDFVVLGEPPQAPSAAAPEDDAARQRAAQLQEKQQAFDAVKNEAVALNVPILTRTQFLRFVGTVVPPNADKVAAR